jgi:hypothetical protein
LNAHEQLLAEGYFGRKLAEMRFIRATRSIPDEALSPPTLKARKLALNTLPRNGMGNTILISRSTPGKFTGGASIIA